MKHTSRLLALILIFSLLLSACSGGGSGAPADSSGSESVASTGASSSDASATSGGAASDAVATKDDPNSIVAGFFSEPGRLDPQYNVEIVGLMIERQIYEPLVDKDPETGEILPCLATEWSWDDDTHLRLKLREGVKFHNGEDFTADDVLYTLERIKVGSASAALYASFDAANSVAEDDYTVVIAFTSPFAPALNFLTNGRAYMVPKDYVEENGDNCLDQNPIGTGPFRFVEWVISSHCDMVRNDDYWGDKPAFENLKIRFIIDDTARNVALETGELDIAVQIQESDINNIVEGNVPHLIGYKVPGQQVNYFAFNTTNIPAFGDQRVRQAMAHAVDWETALYGANGDIYQLIDSCIPPVIDYYTSIGTYEYDVEKAKQLLEEAGYAEGLTFNCIINDTPAIVRLFEILQQYWAEVGITMEIQSVDTATWQESLVTGTSDTSLSNMTTTTGDPHHAISGLLSTSTNITGKITDEHFNELANQGLAAMDETERAEIYAELQQYMYDNVFVIPMFVGVITYGVWDYIDGFYPDPGRQVKFAGISIKQ